MKNLQKNKQGFAHIGMVLLAAFVMVAVGGIGYRVFSKKAATATPDQNQRIVTVSNKAKDAITVQKEIENDVKASYPNSDFGNSRTSIDSKIIPDTKLPWGVSINVTSDLSFVWDVKSLNGGQNALHEKITQILNKQGLKIVSATGAKDVEYQSSLLYCELSTGLAGQPVHCVTGERIQTIAKLLEPALAALVKAMPDKASSVPSTFTYFETTDKIGKGFVVTLDGVGSSYYIAEANNTWQFVGRTSEGTQGELAPSCSIADKPEYRGVFANICEKS